MIDHLVCMLIKHLPFSFSYFSAEKTNGNFDKDPINDAPDNDVDDDEHVNRGSNGIITTLVTSTTINTPPEGSGMVPFFSNENSLIKFLLKPSGNMIKIKCPAKGIPEPKWEWTKNGEPIERKLGQVAYNKMGITLEDLIPADSGNYTCKVCNEFGCISFTSKLEVTGEFTSFYHPKNSFTA